MEGGGEVFAEPAGLVLAIDLNGLGRDFPNDQQLVIVLLEGLAVLLPQINDPDAHRLVGSGIHRRH